MDLPTLAQVCGGSNTLLLPGGGGRGSPFVQLALLRAGRLGVERSGICLQILRHPCSGCSSPPLGLSAWLSVCRCWGILGQDVARQCGLEYLEILKVCFDFLPHSYWIRSGLSLPRRSVQVVLPSPPWNFHWLFRVEARGVALRGGCHYWPPATRPLEMMP